MRARSVVPTVLIVLSSCLLALLPASAGAHEMDAQEHRAEDSASLSAAQVRQLEATTEHETAGDVARAAAASQKLTGQTGSWSPVVNWPVVAIHTALMPDGKVLAYDSIDFEHSDTHDHTRATLWDPQTGAFTPVWVIGHNIFCSGLAHLPDGSIFTAGGNFIDSLNNQVGITATYTFDATTHTWTMGPDMAAARWYPSVTATANGEMLITDGALAGTPQADTPELRTTAGSLRSLTGATIDLPLYPWMDVAPDGRVFNSGPEPTLRSLSTAGAGSWQTFGERDDVTRDYGSRAMFDVGKILVTGGQDSLKSADVIDINGSSPSVSPTGSMAFGRRQHNLTVLADGTVLATGGNSSGVALADLDNGVYAAELWNPQTGQWRTLDSMQVTRQYHSTALLLPDGRVLSAGGGICGDCNNYIAQNGEVFSPPYLFKSGSNELAPRPSVVPTASRVNYNAVLDMSSADTASIRKLALVRLGAVTHSVNMDQRYIPLSYSASGDVITTTTPRNANIAPPGVYMLFAINSAGTPSVAKMITLAPDAPPAPRIAKAKTCRLPSLKGKTRSGAKKALKAAGCKLGRTKKKHLKRFTRKAKKNRVRSQSIKARSVVPAGTPVTITINVKKKG